MIPDACRPCRPAAVRIIPAKVVEVLLPTVIQLLSVVDLVALLLAIELAAIAVAVPAAPARSITRVGAATSRRAR
jgi:hypothetical protein